MKKTAFTIFLIMVLFLFSGTVKAIEVPSGHLEEDVFEVYDQEGKYIFSIGMGVSKGDRYIDENNKEYEVIRVEGKRAIARYIGEVDLLGDGLKVTAEIPPLISSPASKKIALYFTHSGENYLPGEPVKQEKGEIYEVGSNLAKELEKRGIEVIVSENIHLPHDAAAYDRSRRTALQLLKNRPDAIFDIHRDAIPEKKEYLKKVDGKLISQVRIVVGRQNPNIKVNEKVAKYLKATADRIHPGLIKGIFFGRGKYNQDLSGHSLLFEMGSHTTGKERALASTVFLADAIYQLFYGQGNESRAVQEQENKSSFRTAIWLLVLGFAGFIGYLYINEGSFEGVKSRLKNMGSREFGFLKRGGKDDDEK